MTYVTSIYNPWGLISPSHMVGKGVYCETYRDEEIAWDIEILQHLKNKFEKWVSDITRTKFEIPRSVPLKHEASTTNDLHLFWDASIVATQLTLTCSKPKTLEKGVKDVQSQQYKH